MVLTGGSPTESWATEYSGLLEEQVQILSTISFCHITMILFFLNQVTAKALPGLSDGR